MKAKKHLGQHFLHSDKVLTQIIDAAEPVADDIILEIGPGKGVLTRKLVFFAGKVIAVEKDTELIPILRETFKSEIAAGKLDLIEQDILDFDPEILRFYKDFTYKLVANIPYYITGLILRKFLEAAYQPESMTLLVQREVAERAVARDPSTGLRTGAKESLLSLSIKAYGNPRIAARVPRGAFVPPPTVESAILVIEDISKKNFQSKDEEELFFQIIKAAFAHKRKVALKNLAGYFNIDDINAFWESEKLEPKARAEDIHLDVWLKLTRILYNASNDS